MLSEKLVRNIQLVFEEIVSQNLVPYSEVYYSVFPIKVLAEYSDSDESLKMNITYSGSQYNPIEGTDELSAVIVKKIAQDVKYQYKENINSIEILLKKPE